MGSLVDTALSRLLGLFLEPVDARIAAGHGDLAPPGTRRCPPGEIEAAVVGLSGGCGATTIAAGLALALAEGRRPVNLISLGRGDATERTRRGPLQLWQLPPALVDSSEVAHYGGVVARIAGARGMGSGSTATIWDVPADCAERAATVMSEVELVITVAHADSDPALSELASSMIGERCRRVLLVANRAVPDSDWCRRAPICVPDARLAARLIRRGRMPGGTLGRELRQLAALADCE